MLCVYFRHLLNLSMKIFFRCKSETYWLVKCVTMCSNQKHNVAKVKRIALKAIMKYIFLAISLIRWITFIPSCKRKEFIVQASTRMKVPHHQFALRVQMWSAVTSLFIYKNIFPMLTTKTTTEIGRRKNQASNIVEILIVDAQAIQRHYGSLFAITQDKAYLEKFDAINQIIGDLQAIR